MAARSSIVHRRSAPWIVRLISSGLACLALSDMPLQAADGDWQQKPYHYVAIDQDVRNALLEFGRNLRIPVKLGEEVKGRLRAMPANGDAKAFLERMAQAHGLIWYFDGTTLHVDGQSAIQTELVALDGTSPTQLDQMLRRLGVADSRFPLRSGGARGIISVSGPPAYRNLVREALNKLKGGSDMAAASRPAATPAEAAAKVRVFRGGPQDGS
ncbi:type III secretion protein C [Bosea lupini]|uniref:Type III secretion protein C n=1 Tax=Bosea lupini TaxID=1036779 RepID=A0A1H7ZM18_9HYPH|nr:type III secretion protein C [Bosea lupini]